MEYVIGVISDTHGLLRPEIKRKLGHCDLIVHAGDIGAGGLLGELRKIAKVIAVRGNTDTGSWALPLRATECVQFAGKTIYVIHAFENINTESHPAGDGRIDIVVFGHTHRPFIKQEGDTLYFNPGSAGPRRFDLPVSMGYIRIGPRETTPEIIEINEE
jgi:hypothetical protein